MQTFIILVCAQNNSSGKNQKCHINEQPKK
jgi:hypothetical protein